MMSDFPGRKRLVSGCDMLDRYVNWGMRIQAAQGAGATTVSEVLTEESDAGSAPFVEFQIMIRDAIEQQVFRNDVRWN